MDNIDIEIKKAKLIKNGCLEVSYMDADCNEMTLKGSGETHPDLRKALDRLVPFFADLTEQREADSIDWSMPDCKENEDLLANISVTGVTFSANDVGRTLIVSGQRFLKSSKTINLNSPVLELDTEYEWDYFPLFVIALEAFLFEVKAYVLEGKRKYVQKELDFDMT